MVTTQAIIDLVNTLSPNPMEEQQQIQPVNQQAEQETTEVPKSITQDQTDEAAPEISPTDNDQPIELRRSQRITKGVPPNKLTLLTYIYIYYGSRVDRCERKGKIESD
jgi:hypothetical protein